LITIYEKTFDHFPLGSFESSIKFYKASPI
jgi:hypothetical protein